MFYPRLLSIAEQVNAQVVLFEVAHLEQAKRVAAMTLVRSIWDGVEIWRDEPAATSSSDSMTISGGKVEVLGTGNGRSVFAWRENGKQWLGR